MKAGMAETTIIETCMTRPDTLPAGIVKTGMPAESDIQAILEKLIVLSTS